MARQKRIVYTLEEQLNETITRINNLENSIIELKEKKSELEKQIKQNRLSELDSLLEEKGLSIEDIKGMLNCTEKEEVA